MAQELKVAYGEGKPPFVYRVDNQWIGFEIDLVSNILNGKGYALRESIHLSDKRLDLAINKKDVDVIVAIKAKEDDLFYSEDIIAFKNYAISKKVDNLKINNVEDLKNHTVAAWSGANKSMGTVYEKIFSDRAVAQRSGGYEEYADQSIQNMLFWRKRAEVIIIDKTIFLWNKKQHKKGYNTDIELQYHDIFPKQNAYQVGFKKKSIRDDFNQGLKEFKASGKYQKLLDEHTL